MAWYPQESSKMGYLRHVVLLYGNERQVWTSDRLRCYAAHLDASGRPDDWLFDSFLFLPTAAPGGASYLADVNRGSSVSGEGDFYAIPIPKPADRQDYEALLDLYFGAGGYLDSLQEAVAGLKWVLPAPEHPHNVVLSIPYPGIRQAMWGSLEPGSRVLNFACIGQNLTRATEDRLAATRWFVEQALACWAGARWPDLNLLGFYWVFETVYRSWEVDDHWLLKELRPYLQAAGMKLIWIPFSATYNTHLLDDYQRYYFDLAFQQPNHLFYVNSPGIRGPAETARARNTGFELEYDLGHWTPTLAERHLRFRHYLDGGYHLGYMNAACAWYHGSNGVMQMHNHPDPQERAFYDDIYRFIKGTYMARGPAEELP